MRATASICQTENIEAPARKECQPRNFYIAYRSVQSSACARGVRASRSAIRAQQKKRESICELVANTATNFRRACETRARDFAKGQNDKLARPAVRNTGGSNAVLYGRERSHNRITFRS